MADRLTEIVAKNLRKVREQRGWTQAELAEEIGLAVEAYGRLERGRVLPRARTLARLALALKVPTDYLLGLEPGLSEREELLMAGEGSGTYAGATEPPELQRLVRKLRSISPKSLGLLDALLVSLRKDLRLISRTPKSG